MTGLPIQFRKTLLYEVGKPIHPPEAQGSLLDVGSPDCHHHHQSRNCQIRQSLLEAPRIPSHHTITRLLTTLLQKTQNNEELGSSSFLSDHHNLHQRSSDSPTIRELHVPPSTYNTYSSVWVG